MKPGRELDALIAEKIFGLKIDRQMVGAPWVVTERNTVYTADEYSTDITAAWDVVDKMIEDGWEVSEAGYSMSQRKWDFTFGNGCSHPGPHCDTASHAICLAALKAIGYEDQ